VSARPSRLLLLSEVDGKGREDVYMLTLICRLSCCHHRLVLMVTHTCHRSSSFCSIPTPIEPYRDDGELMVDIG